MQQMFIFLLVIGGVWAIYLVPPMLNSRRETPLASTAEYSRIAARLNHVARDEMVTVTVTRSAVLARRRRALGILVVAALASLTMALTTSSLSWLFLHVTVDAGLAWYVAVLLQIKQTRAQQVARITPVAHPVAYVPLEEPVRVVAS